MSSLQGNGETHAGATVVAKLRVRGHREMFVATSCVRRRWWVDVTGRWEYHRGANRSTVEYGPVLTRSWPVREIAEIRWPQPEEAAA